jgi:hypothetical protein
LIGAAVVFREHDGFPQRFPPQVQALLAASRDAQLDMNPCFNLDLERNPEQVFCNVGYAGKAKPSFIIWGDSHAAALQQAIAAAAARQRVSGLIAARGGCPPLEGVSSSIFGPPTACAFSNSMVMSRIRQKDIRTVFLVARWALYAEGKQYPDDPAASQFFIWNSAAPARSLANNKAVLRDALLRTAIMLTREGRRVVIVGPVPEAGVNVPEAMAKRALLDRDFQGIGPTVSLFLDRQKFVLPLLAQASKIPGVTILYPQKQLCGKTDCRIEADGHSLYFDSDHLSLHGAKVISPIFDEIFRTPPTAQ